ncbi:MAG: D-2-hydroxyacid dehydrogenase [Deltaproteobacteria bacterium]|nr:MAG: D-2-hydroxyacid dehydrogenase [Deltaproteobacteria bacterium]
MKNLLVLSAKADDYFNLLQEYNFPELEIVAYSSEDEARRSIRSSNIVLGEPLLVAKILHEARCLEWVQSTFAGVAALCAEGIRRDYILTGVKGIHGPLMGEYVFAYILAIERHLFETKENQTAKAWIDMPYRSLNGLTLGIAGLGSIGKQLAKTALHFGMRVVGFKRTPAEIPGVERVFDGSSLGEFLGLLDYLVLVLPRTAATNGLVDYEAFKKMKSSAVIINVGRGNAIVEADLIRALKNRLIRAAVLDVFEEEPLPADSCLWGLTNAFITPHNAALSFPRDIIQIFYKNYQRFLENKPLYYVVDFKRGY